jgi:septal ring factor EnvC (AmiA/AmiB activator)
MAKRGLLDAFSLTEMVAVGRMRMSPGRFFRKSDCLVTGLTVITILCSVALGQAQTFEAAAASAKSDLDKALAELSALEKKIANEKIPLARELNTLESEVIAKRREHTEAKRLQDRKSVDLGKLKAEEKAFTDQNDYLRKTLLEEYIRRFETRIHASE